MRIAIRRNTLTIPTFQLGALLPARSCCAPDRETGDQRSGFGAGDTTLPPELGRIRFPERFIGAAREP